MISIGNPALYQSSLEVLQTVASGNYLGRLVQIFLACKHSGRNIPQVGDPVGIDTSSLQRVLDELYRKVSRPPERAVLSLFQCNHLPLTGVGGANNWRNNFNFQKGYTCYASAAEISNTAFRTAPRKQCSHLLPGPSGRSTLAGATCELNQGAYYRNEDHAKVLRLDPVLRSVTVYNPSDIDFYAPIVAPRGKKIPIAPLIVALYHDSHLGAGRADISTQDFAADFDFTIPELAAYFDDDVNSAEHSTLLIDYPGELSWSPFGTIMAASVVPIAPVIPSPTLPSKRARKLPSVPLGAVTTVAPPLGGHWWDAEQAVAVALRADGWAIQVVGPYGLGYDLIAHKAGKTRYIEVKSSVGPCSPSLTENEYKEACRLRTNYVLAIVEKFDPLSTAEIQWVVDPAHLKPTVRQVTAYSIPRSQWLPKAAGTFL
jgi:hypothetical protein